MSPPRFGRFEVLERLGSGGVGEVLLVVDGSRRLALKRLLPHLEDADAGAAFDREAALAMRLRHRNIVEVLEHGRIGEVRYLLMEYVDGASLHRLLAAGERLPAGAAAFVAHEVCRALACVHGSCDADGRSLDLVHRDVSPANVLVSRRGEVKLCDFGIAKHASTTGARTRPGFVKGKLGYLSPEQASGRSLDGRSDLFAVGVLSFEALTGQHPNGAGDRPSRLVADVPAALDELCARALAADPGDRFTSADEMASALAAVADERDGAGELAAHLERVCPPRPVLGREPTRTLVEAAARRGSLFVALGAGVVTTMLLVARHHSPPRPVPATSTPVATTTARPVRGPSLAPTPSATTTAIAEPAPSATAVRPVPARPVSPAARGKRAPAPPSTPARPPHRSPAEAATARDYMPDPFGP